jgi:hypothetical protein
MKNTIPFLMAPTLFFSCAYAMEQEQAQIVHPNAWFNNDAYTIKKVADDLTESIRSYPNIADRWQNADEWPHLVDPQLGKLTCVIQPDLFACYVAGYTDGSTRYSHCGESVNYRFYEGPCRFQPITALGCTTYSTWRRTTLLDAQYLRVAGYQDGSLSFQNSTGGDITIKKLYSGSLITCIAPMDKAYIWMIGRTKTPLILGQNTSDENIVTLIKNDDDSPILPKQKPLDQHLRTLNERAISKIVHTDIPLGIDEMGKPYQIAGLGTYQGQIVVKTKDNNFLLIMPIHKNQ